MPSSPFKKHAYLTADTCCVGLLSDEFRDTIVALRPHDDKIRVILNKADVPQQQLMRVYGALMWSMGKVMHPE